MVALALGAGACREPFRDVAERIADASRSSDGAWTKLSFLTDEIGARLAGTDALARALPWADVRPPQAGTNVWLRLPPRLSTQAAFDQCAREGVLVMPADPFYPTRSGPPALRLSFGDHDDDTLLSAVERLARALR